MVVEGRTEASIRGNHHSVQVDVRFGSITEEELYH